MATQAQIQRINQIERAAPKPSEYDWSDFATEELFILQRWHKGEASAAERHLVETKLEPMLQRQRDSWPEA